MRKPIKTTIATEIMLRNPQLPLLGVLAEMRKRGHQTAVGRLCNIRSQLRKKGYELPHWRKLQHKKGFIRLNTKRAAVMKELFANPRATNMEIKKSLAKKGIKPKLISIAMARLKMRHWFPESDFSPKPAPIRLTKKQQAMIPKVKEIINLILHSRIFRTTSWGAQLRQDFKEFIEAEIPMLIKRYDERRAKLSTYLGMKVPLLKGEFVRIDLRSKLGIKRSEAGLLVRIIREKNSGLKYNDEIARKLKCSKSEVDELWKAYQSYIQVLGRTGKREEQ